MILIIIDPWLYLNLITQSVCPTYMKTVEVPDEKMESYDFLFQKKFKGREGEADKIRFETSIKSIKLTAL